MIRICFFLCFLIGVTTVQADTGASLRGVKGVDDRQLQESKDYPWAAIGRLNMEENGFCTASLIGPSVALTAAHCLWQKKRKKWMPPHRVHFLAGYNRGDWVAHAAVMSFHVSKNYRPTAGKNQKNARHDWAILRLAKPLGQQVGSLAFAPQTYTGQPLAQAGYSQDKAHILSVNQRCQVIRTVTQDRVLYHRCDAVSGDSGSPLFYWAGNVPQVTHIHVATTKKGQAQGIAIDLAAARAYLKKRGLKVKAIVPEN